MKEILPACAQHTLNDVTDRVSNLLNRSGAKSVVTRGQIRPRVRSHSQMLAESYNTTTHKSMDLVKLSLHISVNYLQSVVTTAPQTLRFFKENFL